LAAAAAAGRAGLDDSAAAVDRYWWVVPWVDLQQRFLLPDADAEAAAFEEDEEGSHAETYAGASGGASGGPRLRSGGRGVPAFLALPLRTHQWHPDLDAPVAQLLEAGATLVVVAEWTLVDTGASDDDDTLARHDVHQAAAPAAWERVLRARVGRRLPAKRRKQLLARLHWLPPLAARDYLSVLFHARGAVDSFPVANAVGCLDALAVGTPVVSAPPLQRLGFRLGGALWHGLLAHCPRLATALADAEAKWPLGGGEGNDGGVGTCGADLAAAAGPVSYDNDEAPLDSGGGGGNSGGGSTNGGGSSGPNRRSASACVAGATRDGRASGQLLLERYGGWLPPVADDAAGLVRAALEVGDPHDPRLANHLRAAVNACRGSLFGDDRGYAADLRRFLLAAARCAAPSGELYPASSGGPMPYAHTV
jgi:hypothetical protein